MADLQGQLTAISDQMALVSSMLQNVSSNLQSLSNQVAELNTRSQQSTVRDRVLVMLPSVVLRAHADMSSRCAFEFACWGSGLPGRH